VKTLPERILLLSLLIVVAGAAHPRGSTATVRHFGLASSIPADKTEVHAVGQIRLVFTQEPAQGSLSVRLLDAAGEPVATSAPVKDAQDAKSFTVKPSSAPAPGSYTVSWRGMGADGHVVRGDFSFSVMAH
jgi:methionine-rich copper-binding protein CopC